MTEGREFSCLSTSLRGLALTGYLSDVTVAGRPVPSSVSDCTSIYDNQGWNPERSSYDAGTVDSTTTGSKTVTIDVSAATVGNRFVWMSAVAQGAASSQPFGFPVATTNNPLQ
jgi:hypothetical protein